MRLLQLLGCLLIVVSCSRVSNQANSLEIQCGPSSDTNLVKVLSANGHELLADSLSIHRRAGESFSRVAPTAKGCFVYDPESDFVVSGPENQALVVTRGQDLRLVTLRDVQTSDLLINCPTQAISKDFDLAASLSNPGDMDGFSLDLRIGASGHQPLMQQAALVSRQDYGMRPFHQLADGAYTVEFRVQNLLKNLRPRSFRCELRIDSTVPQLSIDAGSFLPRLSQGFTLIEPTAKIRFKTQDDTRTEIQSCWMLQKESMLTPMNEISCSLKALGDEVAPPAEGYWILAYQAVDEAGQRSPVMQHGFLVYQGGAIREISLEMELAQILYANNQNLRAVQKTLAAETGRRRLPTALERDEMVPVVDPNLYQMSVKKIPYLEKKMANLRLGTLTPDGTMAILNQLDAQSHLIGMDAATGRELWRSEHPNGRAERLTFTADSKRMITSGPLSGEILIWSTATGELLRRLPRPDRPGFENKVFEVFLAGNDRYLGAPGFDDTLLIYDLEQTTAQPITSLAYDNWLLSFAWSPSGERFVTSEGKNAHVYTRDGTLIQTVTRADSVHITSAVMMSDDEVVLAAVEKTDRENRKKLQGGFFYARLGQEMRRLASFTGGIDKILPSPDRKHFLAIGAGSLGAPFFPNWREHLETPLLTDITYERLNGDASTEGAYWSNDSQKIATSSGEDSADNMVRVQDADGGRHLELGPGASINFMSDQGNRLLIYTTDGRLEFWNLDRAPIDRMVLPQRIQVARMARDSSRFLTIEEHGEQEKLLRVWDRSTLQELRQVKTTAAFVNTLMCSVFLTADELIMPLDQYRLQSLDIKTGESHIIIDRSDITLSEKRGPIIAFAVSRDGHRLALGYAQGFVEIFDLKAQKTLFLAELHKASSFLVNADFFSKAVSSLGFRGNSYDVVSSGQDGQLMMLTAEGSESYVSSLLLQFPDIILHIDVDETHVAVAPRLNGLVAYEFATGQVSEFLLDASPPAMVNLNVRENLITAITFAGDLFTFNFREAQLRHRIVLKRGVQEVRALSLSGDGREILTAIRGEVLLIPNASATLYEKFCTYLAAMSVCPSVAR
ncbi:MAG TPA: WD40 repeat domain-containing protein [Oligoflexus sp.]|uniref:WD40 repeat domain-containing protein n=1 Tax=Oligoflexus sp. TaxID=1971216 RepID=UPI002D50E6E4|nr:WD40 repeat domain-containing protein [Oligoflexus sp.]HYX33457.1 WD40 repeat domain-containing protein [Oligoflexus sp.]